MVKYGLGIIIGILIFWIFINSKSLLAVILRWLIIFYYGGLMISFFSEGKIKSGLILGLTIIICFAPLIIKKITNLKNS